MLSLLYLYIFIFIYSLLHNYDYLRVNDIFVKVFYCVIIVLGFYQGVMPIP